MTCSPDIVYPAPRISVWHPSCCTTQHPCCSSTLPFHFPFKRSRKNHEGPLLLTLKTDLISAEEDGTQLTNRTAPLFLPYASSAAQNRMMLQGSVLLVCLDPCKEASEPALFSLWLAILIYLPCCSPWEVCSCS